VRVLCEESNVNNGLVPSAAILSAAIPAQALPLSSALLAECYSVQIRRDGDTDYWAISDIDPAELSTCGQSHF
jgi:hypothetical protein